MHSALLTIALLPLGILASPTSSPKAARADCPNGVPTESEVRELVSKVCGVQEPPFDYKITPGNPYVNEQSASGGQLSLTFKMEMVDIYPDGWTTEYTWANKCEPFFEELVSNNKCEKQVGGSMVTYVNGGEVKSDYGENYEILSSLAIAPA